MASIDSDKRYERTLVGILFFTWGTVFLDRMSQMYLAPYFAPEFHLTREQIGTLASVLAITWAASTFFFGALSDRVGRRPVLIPAVFAFSALSWMSGLAHSFHHLLIIRALMGIAEGPTWSIMTALIEESSPPTRRGRNIGLVVSAAALVGLAAAPVLTTQVASRMGWRSAFFVAGIPGLLAGLLIWKFVKEPSANGGVNSDEVGTRETAHRKPSLREYFFILRYRNIWLCCIGATGFMSWLFALNVFAPLYITEVRHEPATTAGLLLGSSGLGSFFLGFLLPSLSDRAGRKPILLLMAALSAVVPLAFLCPFLYLYPLLTAAIIFCDEYRPGHCQPRHGAHSDGERSGGISRDLDRAHYARRRDHGRDRRSDSCRSAGGKARTRVASVAGCGRKRFAISFRSLPTGT